MVGQEKVTQAGYMGGGAEVSDEYGEERASTEQVVRDDEQSAATGEPPIVVAEHSMASLAAALALLIDIE